MIIQFWKAVIDYLKGKIGFTNNYYIYIIKKLKYTFTLTFIIKYVFNIDYKAFLDISP